MKIPTASHPDPAAAPQEHKPSFLRDLRNYMLAGLLVAAPVGITWWICAGIFNWIDSLLRDPITQHVKRLMPSGYVDYVNFPLYGAGIIGVVVFLIILGAVAQNFVGRRIIRMFQFVMLRVPIVNWVYNTTLQISEALLSSNRQTFSRVVLIEFPRPGLYAVGLVTNQANTSTFVNLSSRDDLIFIFVPTTPNPTSGWLFIASEADTYPLNITVDEAIKMVVSGGVAVPDALNFPIASSTEIAAAAGAPHPIRVGGGAA